MGQLDRGVRILVIDPGVGPQLELSPTSVAFDRIDCLPQVNLASVREQLAEYDVVVVGVDCSVGLQLVGDLCSRPLTPPVIAICGKGFEGKSPEHVLLLAELRGAAASLAKPLEAGDLILAARSIPLSRRPGMAGAMHASLVDAAEDGL